MADRRIGNTLGVAARNASDSGQATNQNGSTTAGGEHWDTDYASITALRSRLNTIASGTYTTAKLNEMTYNDLVYAVRLHDSPGTI